jgi:hypothetical protein
MCTIININVIIDTHILVKINSMLPSNLRILFSTCTQQCPNKNRINILSICDLLLCDLSSFIDDQLVFNNIADFSE